MATIGTFTQTQNDFSGDIATLTIQARKVAIVAETERTQENAPTHRIYLGKTDYAECGVMLCTSRILL